MANLDHRQLAACSFALINPMQVDETTWKDLPVQAVVPSAFRTQPHLLPRLLPLSELDSVTRTGLLDRAAAWEEEQNTPWLSALLVSDAGTARVRRHLTRCLAIPQSNGTSRLFRYHDPRVFRHLPWVLEADQMDALLGPVATWRWPREPGDWVSHERGDTPMTPLRLSSTQQATLMQLGEVNTCLDRVAETRPTVATDARWWPVIHDLLQRARHQYQLTERDDRLLFTEQAVRFHPRIHRHTDLAGRLRRAEAGDSSYVAACRGLDEAALTQMAAELSATDKERA